MIPARLRNAAMVSPLVGGITAGVVSSHGAVWGPETALLSAWGLEALHSRFGRLTGPRGETDLRVAMTLREQLPEVLALAGLVSKSGEVPLIDDDYEAAPGGGVIFHVWASTEVADLRAAQQKMLEGWNRLNRKRIRVDPNRWTAHVVEVGDTATPGQARIVWMPYDPLWTHRSWPFAPGESPMGSIHDDAEVGVGRHGELRHIPIVGGHIGAFGATGSGKSKAVHTLVANLAPLDDCIILAFDIVKRGGEFGGWLPRLGGIAVDETSALRLMDAARDYLDDQMAVQARASLAGGVGGTITRFSWRRPAVVLLFDEVQAAISILGDALFAFVTEVRSAGGTAVLATQDPTDSVLPAKTRDQLVNRAVFRLTNWKRRGVAFGSAEDLVYPIRGPKRATTGVSWLVGTGDPELARWWFLADEAVPVYARASAHRRPPNPWGDHEARAFGGWNQPGEDPPAPPPPPPPPGGGPSDPDPGTPPPPPPAPPPAWPDTPVPPPPPREARPTAGAPTGRDVQEAADTLCTMFRGFDPVDILADPASVPLVVEEFRRRVRRKPPGRNEARMARYYERMAKVEELTGILQRWSWSEALGSEGTG